MRSLLLYIIFQNSICDIDEEEAPAKVLSALMTYAGNWRIFWKEEKGTVSAVKLLHPFVQNLDKYLVSILAAVMPSKKCRKQMVVACARGYLQKLVGWAGAS